MAVSDAQKKSSKKWDAENMATLAVRVKKEVEENFRGYCSARGITVNTALRDYVQACINGETVVSSPAGDSAPIMSPSALSLARDGAQKANETLPAFLERAVTDEIKRDEMKRRLDSQLKKD